MLPAVAFACPLLRLWRCTDSLTRAPDPLSEEVQKIGHRQERGSDTSQHGRRMVNAEVPVYQDRDHDHAASDDIADKCGQVW